MRLDENEGAFTIPEFGKIQFEGFCRFVDQGLMEELHNFPKIEDTDKEIEFRLFGNEYELAEPFIKERDAVYQSLTYNLNYMYQQDRFGGIVGRYRNKLYFSEIFL